jgi:hypothetical protein
VTIRYQITAVRRQGAVIQERLLRMGWRVQVTNVPKERLSLSESVADERSPQRRSSVGFDMPDCVQAKQVLEIEGPHHWCQESIEKLAPWVWLLQSVLSVWYLTVGRTLPEAESARRDLGAWDTEWSLNHWVRVFRMATMSASLGNSPDSDETNDPAELIERAKN